MRKHLWSTVALLVMVFFAFGSVSSDKSSVRNAPERKPHEVDDAGQAAPENNWPYQFLESKTEQTGLRNKMDLYAFSGDFDPVKLKEFCRERKSKSTAQAFYHVVIFDNAANAKFPSTPFTAGYSDEEQALKHIRAIYVYNRMNGYSELSYHPQNLWEHVPTREKI